MKITFSRQATVQVAEMGFDKLFFSAENEIGIEGLKEGTKFLKDFVNIEFNEEYQKIKQGIIQEQLKDKVRFYEKDGKKYPSVTSILSFAKGYPFYPGGYAERGTVLHAYMERWAKEKKTREFDFKSLAENFPELIPELMIVKDKGLDLECLKVKEVIENLTKLPFEIKETEVEVFNDEYKYAGRADVFGVYEKESAIIDYKSGSSFTDKAILRDYFQQQAAYAKAEPERKVKKMVLIPFDTKLQKIRQPIVETNIDAYYSMFLAKRKKFTELYKI